MAKIMEESGRVVTVAGEIGRRWHERHWRDKGEWENGVRAVTGVGVGRGG